MITVCHISTVHAGDDVRIFQKECATLGSDELFDVHLVGNGPIDVANSNIKFHNLPHKSGGRLVRMIVKGWYAYKSALNVKAKIYHIHDPELLPFALLLKITKNTVIYDAHEDVPRDILNKEWIPKYLRKPISAVTEFIENFICKKLDLVIAATPFIRDRFLSSGINSIAINNYPKLKEFHNCDLYHMRQKSNKPALCYTGGIMKERGIFEMIEAVSLSGITLNLAGAFSTLTLKSEVISLPEWNTVKHYGFVKREKLNEIFSLSFAGLVVFYPIENHINAQPNKLFEYMSAGLPVIASNFPLWKKIIETVQCGICVDPLNPKQISEAIIYLLNNPSIAENMGKNGQRAIIEKYNWEAEGRTLIKIYRSLVGETS